MKRFTLLLITLITALWLPVLTAHAGEQNGVCGEGKPAYFYADQDGQSEIKADPSFVLKEQKINFQEQENKVSEEPKAANNTERQATPLADNGEQPETPQKKMELPVQADTPTAPVKEPESLEEPSGESFSFNFLYYLFYKFDISKFFKATGLN